MSLPGGVAEGGIKKLGAKRNSKEFLKLRRSLCYSII